MKANNISIETNESQISEEDKNMEDPDKNEEITIKKKRRIQNKLNDLTAKEWLINTKSVWEHTDYHLDKDYPATKRHLKNLVLFFTKKGHIVFNPNNSEDINEICLKLERKLFYNESSKADFIILEEKKSILNLLEYNEYLSNKVKKKYKIYFNILKDKKYLCIIIRDFYVSKQSELILFHYDLTKILTEELGLKVKGLTIWKPKIQNQTYKELVINPNDSIINDYILIFRKETNSSFSENEDISELLNNNNQNLIRESRFFPSFQKSISPIRDKFKSQHPATFPEPDIKKLITFFSDLDQEPKIFDPFVGVGSTLIASSELNIEGYGIELTKKWIDLAIKRCFLNRIPVKLDKKLQRPKQTSMIDPWKSPSSNKEKKEIKTSKQIIYQRLYHGDASIKIKEFPDQVFDFIVTSPPYWGILTKKIDHKMRKERVEKGFETKYSIEGEDDSFKKDLANLSSYHNFLLKLKEIYKECYKKLKNNRYMVVIVSDFRNGPDFYLFHGDTAHLLKKIGFKLTSLTILYQDSKNLYPYGYPFSFVSNIHHQFIITVKKEE